MVAGERPTPGGNWELTDLLGRGPVGEVWKVRHHNGLSVAALKLWLDVTSARDLRAEADVVEEVLRQAKGPGVVVPLEVDLRHDPPFFVSPLLTGGNLTHLIREWAGLPLAERLPLANGVAFRLAEILAPLHRQEPAIVHRDLKPTNVLVDVAAGEVSLEARVGRLHLSDFGIGWLRYPPPRAERAYFSPQQQKGDDPDPRDDVYALGVLWLQALRGDLKAEMPPGWDGALAAQGVQMQQVELMRRCLADDAAQRPADASEVARMLAQLSPTLAVAESVPSGYKLVLESFSPAAKIAVIKVAREVRGFGLAEAKHWVEHLPATIREDTTMEEAASLRQRFADVQAVVSVQPLLPGTPRQMIPAATCTSGNCSVVLESFPPAQKIAVIKVVREVTGCGLAESKDLVERAPTVVMVGASAEKAERIAQQLREAGGRVSVEQENPG